MSTVPVEYTDWLALSKPAVVTVKISPTIAIAIIVPVEIFLIATVVSLCYANCGIVSINKRYCPL